jgi:predicted dehydrogenase
MESRRRFLQTSAGAVLATGSVLGASDRIQVGLIGYGRRGGQLRNSFARHSDCVFAAACDVEQSRLAQGAAAMGGKVDTYSDYRRILERKDIDAVIVATPDHWHSPILIAACEAGKDVYIEKPASNEVEPAWRMVAAAKKYNRVVQVGCQQRSWSQFQDCAKRIQEGYLGRINHCTLLFEGGGGGSRPPAVSQKPPEGLDWEAWQGPAERRPYSAGRHRSWRSYFDYGGGTVTDWGVHFSDVMTWYMKASRKAPILASAAGQYISMQPPDLAMAPDTYSVTWKYDNFVGTFTNTVLPSQDPEILRSDAYGNYFYGENGVLLVNRYGYAVMPNRRRSLSQPAGGPAGSPSSPAQAVKAERVVDPEGMDESPDSKFAQATIVHARNFLDCVKSRQQPVCDMETGFYSSLPCLLAVMSIRQGRSFTWDGNAAKAV